MIDPNQPNGFKQQVKSHYAQHQLSAEQLHALKSINKHSQWPKIGGSIAIASCLIAGISWYFQSTQSLDYTNISQQIAYNHNIKLQMEVLSPDFSTVQKRLNKLGFTLVSSNKLADEHWQIIGGRYCNINGKIAAQMRLVNNNSKEEFTFYQANVSRDIIDSMSESEVSINGVKVKLWREKGLLMGLAF